MSSRNPCVINIDVILSRHNQQLDAATTQTVRLVKTSCGDLIAGTLSPPIIPAPSFDEQRRLSLVKQKEPILRWLLKALSTSVGRKFVMAITGLLLCGFLVAHLGGNLLLWAGDGGTAYNEYAHTLHKNEGLLMIAETGLFGLFIAHIVIAFQISAENRLARKTGYAMKRSKQEGRYSMEPWRPDQWMLVTGIVVLGFIILHLIDFKLELRGSQFYEANGKPFEPYDKAKALLSMSNPISLGGYAIGCLFLTFHLAHGFQSAFQTLGLNHPKYTPLIKIAGLLFALAIGIGFASFPLLWGPSQ